MAGNELPRADPQQKDGADLNSTIWNKLRRISRITFKSLAALFMAVVVAATVFLAWNAIQDRRLERIVSQTSEWEEKTIPLKSPVTVTLKTRCSGSVLYYQLTIRPKDEQQGDKKKPAIRVSRQAFEKSMRRFEEIYIQLYDRDYFLLIRQTVIPKQLIRILDENGKTEKFSANANTFCDKKLYAQVEDWSIGWTEKEKEAN